MSTASNKRLVFNIILSCWLLYTFSMCMKMVYSASMVAIKDEYNVSHFIASLPITLYYALYAVIQLFLAVIMRRINMKLYMLITFTFSGLSFISVFFFSPVWFVCSVMAINGITLGAVWCGSLMVFSKYLTKKQMRNSLLLMGAGATVGNTVSYGISALAMSVGNWRWSFLIMGAAFLFATAYMIFSIIKAEKNNLVPDESADIAVNKKQVYTVKQYEAKPLIIMGTIVSFFACILYYAFTNWMPTILKGLFGMENSEATVITMIFPVAVFAGVYLSNYLSDKVKNDFLLTLVASIIVAVLSLVLCFVFNVGVAICVAVIVLLGISLRVITSLNCSLVTLHTKDYFNSGATGSIINSSACVAAGVSPVLISLILDLSGGNWQTGFIVLFGASIILTIVPFMFLLLNIRRKRKGVGDSGQSV